MTIHVEIYQSQAHSKNGRVQRWRWRARNAGNQKIMAQASEAYTNRQDCLDALGQLFGAETDVILRGAEPTTLREATPAHWKLKLP